MANLTPYDTHTSATDPTSFERGFERAARWIQTARPERAALVHQAIATSDNRYWRDTAARIGFRPDAYGEGLALGIYGIKALEAIDG